MEKPMTYEQAMKRLETIVSLLEGQQVSLDESIELFQEGMKLSSFCDEKLQSIQAQVTQIFENGELKPFGEEK